MGLKEWILPTVLGSTLVAAPFIDAVKDPLDSKEHFHTHVDVGYMHVSTTGNIVILPPRTDTRITPGTGTLTLEGQQSYVV